MFNRVYKKNRKNTIYFFQRGGELSAKNLEKMYYNFLKSENVSKKVLTKNLKTDILYIYCHTNKHNKL